MAAPLASCQRRAGRGVLAVALLVALPGALAPAVARAADSTTQQVEELGREGLAAYNAGDHGKALELFERAYRLRPVTSLLYNMAKSHDKLGNADKAIELLERYAAAPDADPALRTRALDRAAQLREARRKAAASPSGTGASAPPAAPGATASAPSAAAASTSPRTGSAVVAPPPASPGPAPRAPAAPSGPRPGGGLRVAGFVLLGLGVAALGGAVAMSLVASSTHDQFAASRIESDKLALRDTGRSQALVADVCYGAAAASLAVGVGLLAAGYTRKPGADRATLRPLLAPQLAGVALGGSF